MNAEERKQLLDAYLRQVGGQLIVSCQALSHEPLHGSEIMARMAVAALQGGAKGLRANSPEDIRAIKQKVDLPLIGIYKDETPGLEVFITPTVWHCLQVAEAGAEVIAFDATQRPHPKETVPEIVRAVHEQTRCLVMADVSTLEEGLAAEAAGVDLISTTLSGYTPYSRQNEGPDLELVRELIARVRIPVIAEGRYHYPEQVKAALSAGAAAVVVGGAITRPQEITARFVKAING